MTESETSKERQKRLVYQRMKYRAQIEAETPEQREARLSQAIKRYY